MLSREEKLPALKFLLDHGANVMARSNSGWTVLHFAAESSALDIVKYLVEEKQAGTYITFILFLQTFCIGCFNIDDLVIGEK